MTPIYASVKHIRNHTESIQVAVKMIARGGLPALATALVLGCTTINPYTQEEQTARATRGAAIGAAAGAVVGLITGDDAVERRQHALIGAGIGARRYRVLHGSAGSKAS